MFYALISFVLWFGLHVFYALIGICFYIWFDAGQINSNHPYFPENLFYTV